MCSASSTRSYRDEGGKTETSGPWPRFLQKGWLVTLSSVVGRVGRVVESNSVLMVVGGSWQWAVVVPTAGLCWVKILRESSGC